MSNQKGFAAIIILVGILVLASVGGAYYFLKLKTPEPKACTMDAKICPDGSSVGRTGPNCEFTPCPSLKPTNTPDASREPTGSAETANWKTYSDSSLSFKYPSNWSISGYIITSDSPKIRLAVIPSDSTLVTECMKADSTETRNGLVIRKFSAITVAMCAALDPTDKEIWIMKSASTFAPGISYSYSSNEGSQAEAIFDRILSTFKFLPASDSPTPITKNSVITEEDSGKSFSLTLSSRASLRLTNQYLWENPQMTGFAVRLEQVSYVQDPGFSEWNIVPLKEGKVEIASSGTPNCLAGKSCPNRDIIFKVTMIVSH